MLCMLVIVHLNLYESHGFVNVASLKMKCCMESTKTTDGAKQIKGLEEIGIAMGDEEQ
jgi:hypothetical protein